MSELMDGLPVLAELVASELGERTSGSSAGREGMSGEQVLRALVLKQMLGLSYAQLAFHLADSNTYRAFCRIGLLDNAPRRSTLQSNIKQVGPQVLEQVNRALVLRAKQLKVESGKKSRIDSTVIDANIHPPLDSNLLNDVVQVLTRLMKQAAQLSGRVRFSNHTKRAKRRAFGIVNAASMAQRVPLYAELVELASWTTKYAIDNASLLAKLANPVAQALAAKLQHYAQLGLCVIDQTRRRVLQGESVPASEKIVSIFEPHTDVIVKDKRQTLYGHKVFLNVGASGLVLDMLLERGNPADATRATTMLERHARLWGRVPEKAAFDAGFTSNANIVAARTMGVRDAAFAKKGSIEVLAGVRTQAVHKQLQHFRAGVEGIISFTKRCLGLGLCLWRGYRSFQSYAWASVISCNLLLLARATL